MNLDLAHKILESDASFSKEEIEDAFELKCFTIKKEILMQSTFLESFLKNKIRLINQLEEAKSVLIESNFNKVPFEVNPVQFNDSNLIDFFTKYEELITNSKLRLSQSSGYEEIIKAILNINNIQKGYLTYLEGVLKQYDLEYIEEIPLKNQIDSGVIIKELKINKDESLGKELNRIERLSKIL